MSELCFFIGFTFGGCLGWLIANVARDKDPMDPHYGCKERRDERLMDMAKMLDRKFR